MIQDADQIVRDTIIQADICIVGGGPAGITLAIELAKTGNSILLLESGDIGPSGVVDADGKVFGVNNLYIASSAVFPTSSQANPTLTIVALAMRLAGHLHARSAQVPQLTTAKRSVMVN